MYNVSRFACSCLVDSVQRLWTDETNNGLWQSACTHVEKTRNGTRFAFEIRTPPNCIVTTQFVHSPVEEIIADAVQVNLYWYLEIDQEVFRAAWLMSSRLLYCSVRDQNENLSFILYWAMALQLYLLACCKLDTRKSLGKNVFMG